VQQGFQNFIHHADVIVAFKLVLHVHQIFGQRIQAPGEQLGDMQAQGRRGFEQFTRLFDDVKGARFHGPDRSRMRATQQYGKLTEDQPRLRGGGDPHIVLQNFDCALDQKIQRAGLLALPDDKLAGVEVSPLVTLE